MHFKTLEQRLIDYIKLSAGNRYVGDDCAELPGGLLVTVDTLKEGTHFELPPFSLEDAGWKSVAVNLSDVAAMAGVPKYLLVACTLPEAFPEASFRRLFDAMLNCARQHRTQIVGGDITRGKTLAICITVLGEANPKGSWRRSGARPDDVVAVTGDFGSSAAGLWALTNNRGSFDYCVQRQKRPRPRIDEALELADCTRHVRALMDASDGLADCLSQIAESSGVGIQIDEKSIPIAQETRELAGLAGANPLDWALYGGEDYELVACVEAGDWERVQKSPGCKFRKIGRVTNGKEVAVKSSDGQLCSVDLSRTFQHLHK